MEESKEESILYMPRRTKVSLPLSTSTNPMKRHLSREDSSVAWYNLEKTKPLKEYRCTEFDDPMRKADSHKNAHPMEDIKHGELENAIGNSYYNYATEPTSSKSTKCDSSAPDLEDADSNEGSQPGFVKRKKLKLEKELKTGEYLPFEALVDVRLSVKASPRAEKVPFVRLTSKVNGKPILGYPIEVGELSQDSETLFPRRGSFARKLFGDDQWSRFHRLSWRTSKRTPVCYVTNSISRNEEASKNVEGQKQFKQGKAAVSRSCVPVEVIFSKILTAVSQVQS